MKELTEMEEQQFLEGARRALSPTAADAERVLDATRNALALAAAGTGGAPAGSHPGADFSALSGFPASAVALHAGWLPHLYIALLVAAVSGATGFYAGRHAAGEKPVDRQVKARAVSVRVNTPPAARSNQPPKVVSQAVLSTEPEAPETAVNVGSRRAMPREASEIKSGRTETAASNAAGATFASASLEEEIRALKRVDRALRQHDPGEALALLGALDRSVPGGKLAEERFAALMIARCALGFGSPEAIVDQFAGRYPASVYFARVKQSCGKKP